MPRRDPVPGNDTAAITLNAEPDHGGTALIALAAIAAAGALGYRYLVIRRRPSRAGAYYKSKDSAALRRHFGGIARRQVMRR